MKLCESNWYTTTDIKSQKRAADKNNFVHKKAVRCKLQQKGKQLWTWLHRVHRKKTGSTDDRHASIEDIDKRAFLEREEGY